MLELLLSDADAKAEVLDKYIEYSSKVDRICLPPSLIARFKEANAKADISALIGFPYGISDSKTKLYEVIQSYRYGARSIDLFINRMDISNKRYNTVYDELSACYAVAHERSMDFRIVVESRALEPVEIDKISELAIVVGIPGLVLASGTSSIDLADQLIIAKQLMQKTALQVYVGPVWTEDQYTKAVKSKMYGIRFNSTHSLASILHI